MLTFRPANVVFPTCQVEIALKDLILADYAKKNNVNVGALTQVRGGSWLAKEWKEAPGSRPCGGGRGENGGRAAFVWHVACCIL
jgi:hypothetical protein